MEKSNGKFLFWNPQKNFRFLKEKIFEFLKENFKIKNFIFNSYF